MKILVYNRKGGVGKSSISIGLSLAKDFNVVTNDEDSGLENVLPEGRFVELKPGEPVPKIPKKFNVVFDCGGTVDDRIIDMCRQSDKVIVPVQNGALDIKRTIQSVFAIEKFNDQIIIVANNLEKNDFEEIEASLRKHFQYPILPMKKSKVFRTMLKTRQSFESVTSKTGLARYTYRNAIQQFENILKTVTS